LTDTCSGGQGFVGMARPVKGITNPTEPSHSLGGLALPGK
jgi:hypothetical protein